MNARTAVWAQGLLGVTIVLCGAGMTVRARQQDPAARPATTAPAKSPQQLLVDRYCISCHNDRLKTGGLTLASLNPGDVGAHTDTWEKVVRKLRGGLMPPAGLPRPDETTNAGFVAWLETELDRVAAARPNPGRTETFHRLNRAEYRNAVRDVLALEVDVDSLLPVDTASHGFDNVSGGIRLSESLMERYLLAARQNQPHGRRLAALRARRRDAHGFTGSAPGLPCRGSAIRHARRRRRRARLSAGRRVHVPLRAGEHDGGRGARVPARRRARQAVRRQSGTAIGRRRRERVEREDRGPSARPRRAARGRGHLRRRVAHDHRGEPPAVPEPHGESSRGGNASQHHGDRALQLGGRRRHGQPPARFHLPAEGCGRWDRLRGHYSYEAGPTGLSPAGRARGHRDTPRQLSGGRGRGRIRAWRGARSPAAARQPGIPVPPRSRSTRLGGRGQLPDQRRRTGVPAVVLPVEQRARRRAAGRRGQGAAARCGRAGASGAPDARRPAVRGADQQLRRPVAAAAETWRRRRRRRCCSPISTTA